MPWFIYAVASRVLPRVKRLTLQPQSITEQRTKKGLCSPRACDVLHYVYSYAETLNVEYSYTALKGERERGGEEEREREEDRWDMATETNRWRLTWNVVSSVVTYTISKKS